MPPIVRLEKVILGGSVIVLVGVIVISNTMSENDHLVGHDFGSKVSLAVVVFPTTGLESTLNIDLLSPGEMLITDLSQVPPGNYIEPFCLFSSLTI
jgi:hypothetical protein